MNIKIIVTRTDGEWGFDREGEPTPNDVMLAAMALVELSCAGLTPPPSDEEIKELSASLAAAVLGHMHIGLAAGKEAFGR